MTLRDLQIAVASNGSVDDAEMRAGLISLGEALQHLAEDAQELANAVHTGSPDAIEIAHDLNQFVAEIFRIHSGSPTMSCVGYTQRKSRRRPPFTRSSYFAYETPNKPGSPGISPGGGPGNPNHFR